MRTSKAIIYIINIVKHYWRVAIQPASINKLESNCNFWVNFSQYIYYVINLLKKKLYVEKTLDNLRFCNYWITSIIIRTFSSSHYSSLMLNPFPRRRITRYLPSHDSTSLPGCTFILTRCRCKSIRRLTANNDSVAGWDGQKGNSLDGRTVILTPLSLRIGFIDSVAVSSSACGTDYKDRLQMVELFMFGPHYHLFALFIHYGVCMAWWYDPKALWGVADVRPEIIKARSKFIKFPPHIGAGRLCYQLALVESLAFVIDEIYICGVNWIGQVYEVIKMSAYRDFSWYYP